MGLQTRFGELLQELSEEGEKILLVFDAVNELDATHNARALFWLPARLPHGCQVVMTMIPTRNGPTLPLVGWESLIAKKMRKSKRS